MTSVRAVAAAGAGRYGDQIAVPCVFMRGGTSRGAVLRAEDLPDDAAERDALISALYGSPDPRQIDGIGGADPLTSKVAIVSPSQRPDADVDYLFGQVLIDRAAVDYRGNCGNMLSAVAAYAVDEGLAKASEPTARVRVWNTNTERLIVAEVPVVDGRAAAVGDTSIGGVAGTGARIMLDFSETVGTLGRGLFPTGAPQDELAGVRVSIVDLANPVVFVRADDLWRDPLLVVDDEALVERLEHVRGAAAHRLGLVADPADARRQTPGVPKAYAVASPAPYRDSLGRDVLADAVSLLGRGLTAGRPHSAYATTVAVCTAAAALVAETVVAEVACPPAPGEPVVIGHRGGTLAVEAEVAPGPEVRRAAIARTARRLVAGLGYVPVSDA